MYYGDLKQSIRKNIEDEILINAINSTWEEKGGLLLPSFTEMNEDTETRLETYSNWNNKAKEEFSYENIEKSLQVMKDFEEKRERIRRNFMKEFPDNPLFEITKPSIIYCSEEVKEVYEKLASYMRDVGYPSITVIDINKEFLPEAGFLLVEKVEFKPYPPVVARGKPSQVARYAYAATTLSMNCINSFVCISLGFNFMEYILYNRRDRA